MMRRVVREALVNLLATKQRSLLALLGIVIGSGSVIAMLNIGTVAEGEVLRQFQEMGTNLVSAYVDDNAGGKITVEQVERLPERIPGIAAVEPLAVNYGNVRQGGKSMDSAILVGAQESFAETSRLQVVEGRFIADLDGYEMFGVVGATLAERLGAEGRRLAPGDVVTVGGASVTVVGVLAPKATNDLMGINFNTSLFLPRKATRRLFGEGQVNRIVALLAPEASPAAVVQGVSGYLLGLRNRALVRSAEELIAARQKQSRLLGLLLGAIGCISLVVGGIGVMNVMLVSVSERRREIGIRLAVGARRADIRRQFLVEGVILAVIGGVLGTLVGLFASYVFALVNSLDFRVSLVASVLGPTVSAMTGVFFTFYPAAQAAKLDPIQALQSE